MKRPVYHVRRLLLLALFCYCASPLPAADPDVPAGSPQGVSYFRDVRPILQARCFGCHQPAKARGGLDMTDFKGLLRGGESEEPAVVPGDPAAGTMLGMIQPKAAGRAEMPKSGPPLSVPQIDLIGRWIEQGAVDDSPPAAAPRYDAKHPPVYTLPPVITSLDFSSDGALLAVSGYHEVLLHHADGSGLVARLIGLSERIETVRFSPDGSRLAVAAGLPGRVGELQIWDVASRGLLRSIAVTFDTIYGASWSHDGKLVAFGCGDSTLRAIDVKTGQQVFYQSAHSDWVFDTVFSVDSSHLVSVGRDRTMKLNVVDTQRFVDNITSITPGALKGGLNSVDRHPQRDQLLVGGADGVPKIFRMFREKARKIGDDFNLIRKFEALPGRIYSVAYRADGTQIVAGSSDDGAGHVHVFQEADGQRVARMEAIEGGIYSVAFRPDGKVVASGGFAGRVFLHEAETGRLIGSFVPVRLE